MPEEEITDSSEQESALTDSPVEESGVSDDQGSDVESDSQVEEPQTAAEDSAPSIENDEREESGSAAAPQAQQPQQDYQRDYKALQPEYTRTRQELKETQRRMQEYEQRLKAFEGVDPSAVQQFQQKQSLPPWHPQSEQHSRFLQAKHTTEVIQAAPGMTREQKQEWLAQQLPSDDINMVVAWGQYQREEQERMLRDPSGYIESQVTAKVQEIVGSQLNQHTSQQQMQAQVSGMFADPRFREVYLTPDGKSASEWGGRLNQLLSQNIPYEIADQTVRAERQVATMQAEMEELRRKNATAYERDRLLRDNATDTRDVRVGGVDAASEWSRLCAERGIRKDSNAGLELLLAIENKTSA